MYVKVLALTYHPGKSQVACYNWGAIVIQNFSKVSLVYQSYVPK